MSIQKLLERSIRLAAQHGKANQKLWQALEERYGQEVDPDYFDELVDAADYGQGDITLKRIDEIAADKGLFPVGRTS